MQRKSPLARYKRGEKLNIRESLIILVFFIIFSFVCPISGFAQIEISSSPNPVGSGARALGMGGAFIGVADDATAASWNPGGLVQLPTPEISLVVNGFHRNEDNIFESNPEAGETQSVTEKDINYFSVVYPFNLFSRNMILSLNYQNLYDFTRDWDFPLTFTVTDDIGFGPVTITTTDNIHYQQKGNLSALGIAYCIQIVPQFSFGFTLNLWDDDLTENNWESNRLTERVTVGPFSSASEIEDRKEYAFSGFNANIGMLWRTTAKLTTGAVLKLPFTGDLKHKRTTKMGGIEIEMVEEDEKMDMPMSWGIGIAYRFSDKLTLSADFYRTEWQDFRMRHSDGTETSPVTGDASEADPTHQVRIGAEYLFIKPELKYVIPFRAGIFYDPSPSEGCPDDYYGFSLGSGIAIGRYVFDFAYQYRFGNDVGSSVVKDYYGGAFSQDVDEHMIYSSLIVHF